MTHHTEGGSLRDMPSHPFLDGPFSWDASMDGANQNWTQQYLNKARNHSHSSQTELLPTQVEGLL